MSVGDLKYKMFLFKDFNTKKIAKIEINTSIAKSDALFLTFFEALTALDRFAVRR